MLTRIACWAICGAVFVWPLLAGAHPDIELQIAALTDQIARHPNDDQLYYRRAELYRFHEEWQPALNDFAEALRINPQCEPARLGRAETLFESGQPAAAKTLLDEILTAHPADPAALLIRARVSADLRDYRSAVADYRKSIAQQSQPRPEYYVELVQTLVDSDGKNIGEALTVLDSALQKLGSVPTLESLAIDLELRRTNYPAALARVDQMLAQTSRKEFGLLRRGAILEQAGQPAEADATYRRALQVVAELPPWRRHVPAIEELVSKLESATNRLEAVHANP